jgi:nicotinamidase-related amidase
MAVKRIVSGRCCGAAIDVQDFFVAQADRNIRQKIKMDIGHFARLLRYFKIPLIVTIERPIAQKGSVPIEIKKHLGIRAAIFEKDFFDLTRDRKIRKHLGGLRRRQIIVAGCETDVCVLQSCLGLLDLGYDVFVVEDLIFSSSRKIDSAIARMQAAGAVFLTYKTLYFELLEAVGGSANDRKLIKSLGGLPDDLPEALQR